MPAYRTTKIIYRKVYTCGIKVKADHVMTDAEIEAFKQTPRFNALTAAVAIAVMNFNRKSEDGITAETEEI